MECKYSGTVCELLLHKCKNQLMHFDPEYTRFQQDLQLTETLKQISLPVGHVDDVSSQSALCATLMI